MSAPLLFRSLNIVGCFPHYYVPGDRLTAESVARVLSIGNDLNDLISGRAQREHVSDRVIQNITTLKSEGRYCPDLFSDIEAYLEGRKVNGHSISLPTIGSHVSALLYTASVNKLGLSFLDPRRIHLFVDHFGEPYGRAYCERIGAANELFGIPSKSTDAALAEFFSRERVEAIPMTCVRIDIERFTRKTVGMSAPEQARLLRQFFEIFVRVADTYGLFFNKSMGDGAQFIAYGEAHALRAVQAALEISEDCQSFNRERATRGEMSFATRIGVASGNGTPQPLGIGRVKMIEVQGPLMTHASRVEPKADPDTVLVAESTKGLCGPHLKIDSSITIEGKGDRTDELGKPFQAHRVSKVEKTDLSDGAAEIPFVGRDRERDAVLHEFRKVLETGQAHQVTVTGQAGIGRTRFIFECQQGMQAVSLQGLHLFHAQGVNLPVSRANRDFHDLLMAHFGLRDVTTAAAYEKLRTAMLPLIVTKAEREQKDALDLMMIFLGLRLQEPHSQRISDLIKEGAAEERRIAAFGIVKAYFKKLATTKPVVFISDDFQWFDSGSRELLKELKQEMGDVPFFVLLAERVDTANPGTFHLTQLADDDSKKILRAALGDHANTLAESDFLRIVHLANHNPLEIVTIAGLITHSGWRLDTQGLVSPEGARWVGTESMTTVPLAALSQDDREAYDLICRASVLNRDFTEMELCRLEDNPPSEGVYQEKLKLLVERKFLVGFGSADESVRRYRFASEAVRARAYSSLADGDRERFHTNHFRTLSRRPVGVFRGSMTDVEEIAYHAEALKDYETAATYYALQGRHAFYEQGVTEAALPLFQKAYECSLKTSDIDLQWKILMSWDEVLFLSGRPADQKNIYEKSAARVEHRAPIDQAERLFRYGRALYRLGESQDAQELFLNVISATQNPKTEVAISLRANACIQLAMIHNKKGEADYVEACLEEADRLRRQVQDPILSGRYFIMKEYIAGNKNRYSEALAASRAAVAIFESTHDLRRSIVYRASIGNNLILLGQYAEAESILRKATQDLDNRLGGKVQNSETLFFNLGRALSFIEGRNDDAIRILETSRQRFGDHHYIVYHLAYLLTCYLKASDLDKARAVVEDLKGFSARGESEKVIIAFCQAQLAMASCKSEEARRFSEEAVGLYESNNKLASEFGVEILHTHAVILDDLGERENAKKYNARALEKIDQQSALLDSEHRQSFLHNIPVYREARNLHDRLHVNAGDVVGAFLRKLDTVKAFEVASLPSELRVCDGETVFEVQDGHYNHGIGCELDQSLAEVVSVLLTRPARSDWVALAEDGLLGVALESIKFSLEDDTGALNGLVKMHMTVNVPEENAQVARNILRSAMNVSDMSMTSEVPLTGRISVLEERIEITLSPREATSQGSLIGRDKMGGMKIVLAKTSTGKTRLALITADHKFTPRASLRAQLKAIVGAIQKP